MKTVFFIFLSPLLVGVLFITFSCKEIDVLEKPNTVNTLKDTTYVLSSVETPDDKVVVLEEFTGVRCINCANGHIAAENLKSSNPGRVIPIAHHSRFLDEAYPFSYHHLTSEDAQSLSSFIGPVGSKPTASVDRMLFSGESSKILDLTKWSTRVNEQLTKSSPVNIHLSSDYNNADSSTLLTFKAHFTSAMSEPLKYTIMIVETDIVTAQLMPTNTVDSNYIHKDVLREITTAIEGDALGSATITPGRVFEKQFKIKLHLDHKWNPDKCYIVAFIHRSGSNYDILQGEEIPVK